MGIYSVEEDIIICSSGLQTVFYRLFDENKKQVFMTTNPLFIDVEIKKLAHEELYAKNILPERRRDKRIFCCRKFGRKDIFMHLFGNVR